MIVSWTDGIPEQMNGGFVRQYAYLPDFMPTCTELAATRYPASAPPCAGQSMVSLLKGSREPIHIQPIYWEHEGNAGVRWGKWKLVREYGKPWELFDLEADRAEMRDLATEETAIERFQFDVDSPARLVARIDDGSLEIVGTSSQEIRITVVKKARGPNAEAAAATTNAYHRCRSPCGRTHVS